MTLLLLHPPDILKLLDYRGEGVGDDSDHDEDGEQEDQNCRYDVLEVLEQQVVDFSRHYLHVLLLQNYTLVKV